jgi:hypothetical protein
MLNEQDKDILTYKPSRTGELFHASNKTVRLIMGPVGSGKSVTCMFEIFTRAIEMPECIDGIKRSRWAIIRNTYPELKMTTIKTWSAWFPENRCGRISGVPPISQKIKFGNVEIEVCFIALNGDTDVKKLLSNEFTGFYFNELSEIPAVVVDYAISRLGRYPQPASIRGSRSYFTFIIADSNAPSEDSWIVDRFIKNAEKYSDYQLFMQPSPLIYNDNNVLVENRLAENIENLAQPGQSGYEYYWRIFRNSSKDVFDVTVMCKFGTTFDGLPVFNEYSDRIHRTDYEIMPDRTQPLYLGWDFGRTPCAVLGQYVKGQMLLLDEIVAGESLGLDAFINTFALPVLNSDKYKGMRIVSVCDPAGVRRNDTDDNFCIRELNKYGFNAKTAKTNDLTARIETMKKGLSTLVNGQPAILVSKTARMLHEAFSGGYFWKMARNSAGQKVATREPDKSDSNPYHHPMDGAQYLAMEFLYLQREKVEKKPLFVNGSFIYV